jgi:hypothetical protein
VQEAVLAYLLALEVQEGQCDWPAATASPLSRAQYPLRAAAAEAHRALGVFNSQAVCKRMLQPKHQLAPCVSVVVQALAALAVRYRWSAVAVALLTVVPSRSDLPMQARQAAAALCR